MTPAPAQTAPAATTDVLKEYRTKGPLTTTTLGIVAMDDAVFSECGIGVWCAMDHQFCCADRILLGN